MRLLAPIRQSRLLRQSLLLTGILGGALWPSAALAVPRPYWHPGPPWAPLAPRSGEVLEISNLFWVVFVLSMIVLALVCGVLFLNVTRFTGKDGDPEPAQVFGNRNIEIAWTIIPTVVITVAFIATVKAIHDINTPSAGKILNVNVVGHQWWWEFDYPEYRVTTANELHLPTGRPIHFHITSNDVIHSFWTPQLQRQVDANPGIDDAVFVTLDTPGVFSGMCYEYCGVAHAWMKYRVVVQNTNQFQLWAAHERKSAPTVAALKTTASTSTSSVAAAVARGAKLFNVNTCVTCHAITYKNTPAIGAVGPNLTHFGSRWTIGAGAAPNDTANLMKWVHNPEDYKPGVLMPGYPEFNQNQLHDLAVYLESLK